MASKPTLYVNASRADTVFKSKLSLRRAFPHSVRSVRAAGANSEPPQSTEAISSASDCLGMSIALESFVEPKLKAYMTIPITAASQSIACDLAKDSEAKALFAVRRQRRSRFVSSDREKKLERLGSAINADKKPQLNTVKTALQGIDRTASDGDSRIEISRRNRRQLRANNVMELNKCLRQSGDESD